MEEFFLDYVLPLIFLMTGIALLVSAAYRRAQTLAFLARARETTGEVIALEEVPPQEPGAGELETYAPVVVFTADNGRKVKFTSMASSYPPRYAVGDSVPVLYEANRADQARIHSFHDLWIMPALFGGLGLAFTAVGAGLLIFGVPA
ncbi:MAG: hypothetical protein A2V90_08010 [Gammaproteobacteria bacterium RBG_16_57_12]|nr:MAG: hypothetical protein A2V90_08010 [Gammaproteobacteria bacterium RBG_16_57_12]